MIELECIYIYKYIYIPHKKQLDEQSNIERPAALYNNVHGFETEIIMTRKFNVNVIITKYPFGFDRVAYLPTMATSLLCSSNVLGSAWYLAFRSHQLAKFQYPYWMQVCMRVPVVWWTIWQRSISEKGSVPITLQMITLWLDIRPASESERVYVLNVWAVVRGTMTFVKESIRSYHF